MGSNAAHETEGGGDTALEVARFYTKSRKFPRLIGRFHDGTRIPGGPYTFTQVLIGAAVLVVAFMTRSAWSVGFMLGDIVVALAAAWGGAYLGRYIPISDRNPIVTLPSAAASFTRPASGRYRGEQTQFPKPHRLKPSSIWVFDSTNPVSGELLTAKSTRFTAPCVGAASTRTEQVSLPSAEQPIQTDLDVASDPVLVPDPAPVSAPISGVERLLAQARAKN